jgi:hypothetical protein
MDVPLPDMIDHPGPTLYKPVDDTIYAINLLRMVFKSLLKSQPNLPLYAAIFGIAPTQAQQKPTLLAKGENPAWAGQQNGNDPDVLSGELLDWYPEESTRSSRYFIGYYVPDNFVKVVQMFRQFHSGYSRGKPERRI